MTTITIDPRAKQKLYYKKNPGMYYAHGRIGSLIQMGKMKPAKELQCSHCPDQARVYHHPNGYEGKNITDVIPLCQFCHMKAHFG